MISDTSGEYEVGLIKYIHPGYITFQFEIRNLVSDIIIKDVGVELNIKEPSLQLVNEIKAPSIGHKEIGYCYNILSYDMESCPFPVSSFQAKMIFTVVEIDDSTKTEQGSYSEQYVLPEVALSAKDYIIGRQLKPDEFQYYLYSIGRAGVLLENKEML